MFKNRSFYLLVVMAVLVVTACAPQVESASTVAPIDTATVAPTATQTPTIEPTATVQPTDALQHVSPTVDSTPAAESNSADRFAGTWSGTMGYSNDPSAKQDIVVHIPTGCATGGACGDIDNGMCKWELTLVALVGDVFEYQFAKTLRGDDPCPTGVGTSGTLTMQTDGTLMREHKTPNFIVSGVLTK